MYNVELTHEELCHLLDSLGVMREYIVYNKSVLACFKDDTELTNTIMVKLLTHFKTTVSPM